MAKPRYTVDVFMENNVEIKSATFRYPIAWDSQSRPTHFTSKTFPVSSVAVHETCTGFIHVLRVRSLRIPPIQPAG